MTVSRETAAEPTAEHIDAVARAPRLPIGLTVGLRSARAILTSTDPAVHAAQAANLPTDVMLAALVERGVLTVEQGGAGVANPNPGAFLWSRLVGPWQRKP